MLFFNIIFGKRKISIINVGFSFLNGKNRSQLQRPCIIVAADTMNAASFVQTTVYTLEKDIKFLFRADRDYLKQSYA